MRCRQPVFSRRHDLRGRSPGSGGRYRAADQGHPHLIVDERRKVWLTVVPDLFHADRWRYAAVQDAMAAILPWSFGQ